jgi:predicted metal-dependent HD superfamily phosphohydrolase
VTATRSSAGCHAGAVTILIDDARVPQHGRWWCHLASDASFDELHAFASTAGIPERGFDGDHYDVPIERRDDLVASGALPVTSRDLVMALTRAGLRRRQPRSAKRRPTYRTELVTAVVMAIGHRYDEPQRKYHTRRHIDAMLMALGGLWDQSGYADVPREPLVLATWLHDAVYEPTQADNELMSAALGRELMSSLDASDELIDEVERLVLLTTTHDPQPSDRPGELLCDADLSVLGQDAAGYRTYAEAVRQEYSFVDDATFRGGRARVLESLLAREWLYSTPLARERWEPVARANVQEELAGLSEGPR